MIATMSNVESTTVFNHPVTGKRTWLSRYNCSDVVPKIKDCHHFIRHSMANGTMKITTMDAVDQSIQKVREHARLSVKLMKKFDIQYVKVQLEDLIESPRKYAEQMCKVLELNCDENYIQGVVEGVMETPNPTRNAVDWTAVQIEKINAIVRDFPEVFSIPRFAKLQLQK
ncbi:uncharacterized protein LOC134854546 [Symsagittifera roscoffensis]|uniref:uncharacterized protein LOC134854546 n=1 Tax=Symsagittifera roscoffensis TaxID=84072 RepID=UPI00307C076F